MDQESMDLELSFCQSMINEMCKDVQQDLYDLGNPDDDLLPMKESSMMRYNESSTTNKSTQVWYLEGAKDGWEIYNWKSHVEILFSIANFQLFNALEL